MKLQAAVRSVGAVVVLVFSGCLSMGGVQRADTLGKGNFQVAVEPGAMVVASSPSVAGPMLDFAGRFGVSDGVDLGIRLGTTGIELQTKFLLTKPGDDKLALSLAPTVGGFFFGVFNYAALNVPLLIGIKFGEHELILGPRFVTQFVFGSATTSASAAAYAFMPAFSLGFAAQLSENFALIPELTFAVPVAGAFAVTAGTMGSSGAQGANTFVPIVQFKLGIDFGRQRGVSAPEHKAAPIRYMAPPPPPPEPQYIPPPPPPPPPQPGV